MNREELTMAIKVAKIAGLLIAVWLAWEFYIFYTLATAGG